MAIRRPALLLGALLLSACGGEPASPRRTFSSDVEACTARLVEVYRAMTSAEEHGWRPEGARSLLEAPLEAGVWGEEERARLGCPSAEPGARYSERDLAAYPLERFPTRGTEIVLACARHDGALNALYADGSVKTFQLAQEIAEGTLPPGTTAIPIGPESPIEDLRRLKP